MVDFEKIMDMACEQLERVKREDFAKAADTQHIKNLMSIYVKALEGEAMEAEGGYSSAGGWEARGAYGSGMSGSRYSRNTGSYRGNSYAGRGQHYVRGHYSRDDGTEMMTERMREMMNSESMSSYDRDALQHAMKLMER